MKKNLKSSMLNMQCGWGVTVIIICVCLVGYENWFGNPDHPDFKAKAQLGKTINVTEESIWKNLYSRHQAGWTRRSFNY